MNKYFNNIIFNISSFFFLIIILFNIKNIYNTIPGDGWAYNELFINYSEGLIRRGILGSIFLFFSENFSIRPQIFFTSLIAFFHIINAILFLLLIKKFKNFKFIILLLLFSPALLFFPIYEINVFLAKDVFTNFAILLHAYFANLKIRKLIDNNIYIKILNFLVIPIIFFNILNHENQFFFISVHFLISLIVLQVTSLNIFIKKINYFFSYAILLIPIFFVIYFSQLTYSSLENLNFNLMDNFGTSVNSEISGNINLKIGGFLKHHFSNNSIDNFFNFFICLILSVFIIFFIFESFLEKKILNLNKLYKKYYLLFFLPCLGLFIQIDHGRTLNILSIHLVSFYFCLKIDENKLSKLFNINNLKKYLISIFIFLYSFTWFMPQGGGYNGIGNFNDNCSIIKNTFLLEVSRIFIFGYEVVDKKVFNLPYVIHNWEGKFDKNGNCD